MTGKAIWNRAVALLLLAMPANAFAQSSRYPPPVDGDRVGCGYGSEPRFFTTHAYCDQYLKDAVRRQRKLVQNPSVNELAGREVARVCQRDSGYACTRKKVEVSDAVAHCSTVRSAAVGANALKSRNIAESLVRSSIIQNNAGPPPWGISPAEVGQIVRFVYADRSASQNAVADNVYARCLNARGIAYRLR